MKNLFVIVAWLVAGAWLYKFVEGRWDSAKS